MQSEHTADAPLHAEDTPPEEVSLTDMSDVIEAATARIAPTWPLDRFIAVNPLWGFIDTPLPEVAAQVASLSGARLTMPRAWYREQWQGGVFGPRHLRKALERAGSGRTVDALLTALEVDAARPPSRALITHVVDARRDLHHAVGWTEHVVHQISRHCASWFGLAEDHQPPAGTPDLYASWHEATRRDRGTALLMDVADLPARAATLPMEAEVLVPRALEALGVHPDEQVDYLSALLMDVRGWASWCAYRRWTARLEGRDDACLDHLLAIRLAWEWLLHDTAGDGVTGRWRMEMASWPRRDAAARDAQQDDWVLQTALELGHHEALARGLASAPSPAEQARPALQAAFCIDVRSEVYRRALEARSPVVQTVGFAGFFGLPIAYKPVGATHSRPQLPGPLAPRLLATDHVDPGVADRRTRRLQAGNTWAAFSKTPLSGFSFVETMGLAFAPRLLGHALGLTRPVPHPERAGLTAAEHAARRPRLTSTLDGEPLDDDARADLAAGILRSMSLTSGLARVVALVGHGSQTANNPGAAGLDCGACCGQRGDVNARAVAALLNDPTVRKGLAARGLDVPDDTVFLGAYHDTTTDEITVYDLDEVPASHQADLTQVQGWFDDASATARAERAPSLGLGTLSGRRLHRALRTRARDWSEVRPEWGLAGNTGFVVAPRSRTAHLDLGGRVFLHDYRWQDDADFATLELILTAPVVVGHWINFQYYASTVDNLRFGSGNKVLHNVVGDHLGVFEGNGGDLRTGLAMQSLHDGRRWVHEPVRLGVFVQAPSDAIDRIVAAHETVRHLVDHGWIDLHRIDDATGEVFARVDGRWMAAFEG